MHRGSVRSTRVSFVADRRRGLFPAALSREEAVEAVERLTNVNRPTGPLARVKLSGRQSGKVCTPRKALMLRLFVQARKQPLVEGHENLGHGVKDIRISPWGQTLGSPSEHAGPAEGVDPMPLTSANIPRYPEPCDRSIRRRRSRRRCVSRSCAGGASSQQHRDTGGERPDAATGNGRDAESRSGRRLETQAITRRTSAGGFSGAPTRARHLGPGDS